MCCGGGGEARGAIVELYGLKLVRPWLICIWRLGGERVCRFVDLVLRCRSHWVVTQRRMLEPPKRFAITESRDHAGFHHWTRMKESICL